MESAIIDRFSHLPKIKFSTRNLDQHDGVLRVAGDSILSFGVDVLNEVLASLVPNNSQVVEVGCGKKSFFREICNEHITWHGLDVYDVDFRGKKSIATHIGSVHDMPFNSQSIDFVLANQSLEHWFEYGVSIQEGLNEIARVLKPNGQAWLNFPLFLHGDPRCLKGELHKILEEIPSKFFHQINVEFVTGGPSNSYKGWRRCGFPDFLVDAETSLNINLILMRNEVEVLSTNKKKPAKKIGLFSRLLSYGVKFFLWKITMKVIGLDREKNP